MKAQISYNPNDIDNIAHAEAKTFGPLIIHRATRYSPTTDITYARFNLFIRADKDTISGSITFVYNVLNSTDTLTFAMNDTLTLDYVFYHGSFGKARHKNGLLKIAVDPSVSKGRVDSILIVYHGNPPTGNGFGSYVTSVHGSNNDSVIWTLSEPYGASNWWPCKNDLSDKIDSMDMYITTPDRYIASSNGAIISHGTDGTYNYFHFKLHYPVATYLVGIASSNYQYFDTTLNLLHGKVLFTHQVFPESYNYFYISQLAIGQALYLYDSLFGAYPFMKDHYGVTQFGWGGGMEHQTNVFVHDEGYELNVHEMAHQWFGDKITLGSWQDIWLNEGFAVYSSYLCYQYRQNGYWWPIAKKGMIGKVISVADGSVFCTDTTSVNRIFDSRLSYKKGAALLHMLRWEVGDSAFFTGVRAYVADTDLCYKFARTQQFKQHIETSSRRNMDTFFNQWYMGQGFPTYHFTYNQTGTTITLNIRQTTSHPSVNFYAMHIPVLLKSASGKDTLLRLWDNDTLLTYTINNISFTVDSLIFDPDWWIVAGNHACKPSSVNEAGSYAPVFNVYPNPANDVLYISHSDAFFSYRIFDMTGKLLLTKNLSENNTTDIISLNGLPKGPYIVQLQSKSGDVINKSIIIE